MKKKDGKRVIAAILSMVMILTLGLSSAFADDTAAPGSDTAVSDSVSENTVTEETADSTADGTETKILTPVTSLVSETDDYKITAEMDQNAMVFEGYTISLTPIEENDINGVHDAAKAAISGTENVAYLRSLQDEIDAAASTEENPVTTELGFVPADISILDEDGNPIEPQGEVKITIDLKKLPEGMDSTSKVIVDHIVGTDATVESVADNTQRTSGAVEFGETEDGTPTAQIRFYITSFSTFTMSYTRAAGTEDITDPAEDIEDPAEDITDPEEDVTDPEEKPAEEEEKKDEEEKKESILDPDGQKITATGDGYSVEIAFAQEDLPDGVLPTDLQASVSKLSDYDRVDEGIEPIKKTTITLPTFAVSLKDAAGEDVVLKDDKKLKVTVNVSTDILPEMADVATLKLLGGAASGDEEPAVLAAADGSVEGAAIAAADGTITATFETAQFAEAYGFDFNYVEPEPIESTPAAPVRKAARKVTAQANGSLTATLDDVQPTVSKTVTPNGDGTYKITLSVTGKASSTEDSTKADVIVVYDKSSSMMMPCTSYQDDNGPYGQVGYYDQLVPLYTRTWSREDREYKYTLVNNNDIDRRERLYYFDGRTYQEYRGNRYSGDPTSRASSAKAAVDDLAKTLLSNNTNGDVQLSIVTFGKNATGSGYGEILSNATQYSEAANAIENLDDIEEDQGTNWEAALNKALQLVNSPPFEGRENVSKYVIFVSDGDPTYRGTDWIYGSGNSDYYGYNYEAALAKAEDIVKVVGKDNFFGIGAFGNVSNMQNLVTDSGASSSNYYNASDGVALAAAFENITQAITKAMEIRNVTLNDTVTSLSSVGAEVAPGSTVGQFTYSKSNDESWQPTEQNQATVKDGKVSWSPVPDGQSLESEVTYSVSFDVWPSQDAYDLVAQLKNKTITYGELNDEQKAQIVDKGNGTYSLTTNSTAKDKDGNSVNQVTYSKVKLDSTTEAAQALTDDQKAQIRGGNGKDVKIGGNTFRYNVTKNTYEQVTETKGTAELTGNGEMPINVAEVTVYKKWQDASGTDIADKVKGGWATLIVKDGDKEVQTLTLNNGNDWSSTVYLAPGLKLKKDGAILVKGHEYSLFEERYDAGNTGLEFTYSGDSITPMLINGKFGEDTSTKKTLTGVNKLKTTSLAITKTLVGKYVNSDTEFEIQITATDGWSTYLTDSYSYTVTKSGNEVDKGTLTFTNGKATLPIKGGQQIVITNLPVNAKLEIQEDLGTKASDYRVKYNDKDAEKCSLTLQEKGNSVEITNTSKIVVTGVSTHTLPFLMLPLIALILGALYVSFVREMRKRRFK